MPTQVITTDDLREFKMELLSDIQKLFSKIPALAAPKRFLKTHEVMSLLKMSAGTLQTHRNNGTIPFIRVGGGLLYDYDEIMDFLNSGKNQLERA